MSWKCDGDFDCLGQEDEPDSCREKTSTCNENYFKCDNNKCIPSELTLYLSQIQLQTICLMSVPNVKIVGFVTLKTIVGTEATKRIANPESVQKMSSGALMAVAFDRFGGVMEFTIVKTKATKAIVTSLVIQKSSTAKTPTFVFSTNGNAMVCPFPSFVIKS